MPPLEQRYFGDIFEGRICDVLAELWDDLPQFAAAVVRELDSETDVANISAALAGQALPSVITPGGALVSRDVLRSASDVHLFNGFDQLWFLDEWKTPVPPVDDAISLISIGGRMPESMRNPLIEAMARLGSPLALGDGCGLNCVTTDERFWVRLSGTFSKLPEQP